MGTGMFSKAVTLFRRQCDRGAFPGGQVVVRVRGEELLNISVGVARGYREREEERIPVTNATPFQVMSASKPLVAFAVAVLEDRGLVDVERRVCDYIPGFAREGKGEITVLEVLTHRSGVIVPHLWDSPDLWPDWDRVQEEICNSSPRYRRGTLAYHAYEFGWILGEVVRQVAGQPLDRFLKDVLPESLQSLCLRRDENDQTVVAHSYWLSQKRVKLGGQDVTTGFEEKNNSCQTLASLVPGASMTTTASTLAQFYEMLLAGGTTSDGSRLIRSETLERYLTANVTGFDRTLRSYLVLGRGFQLGWLWPHPYGWWDSRACVGHGGGFCVVVFGDRRTDAAIAILTNGNRGLWDVARRFTPLSSALRRAARIL
ncbi:MAG: beta-lactamase family protein [Gemmatimonadota bacterium]|nr:MAG: beta-lactamase family protein [Gemmatimonadota bacterium]